jgi:hypothetical protein
VIPCDSEAPRIVSCTFAHSPHNTSCLHCIRPTRASKNTCRTHVATPGWWTLLGQSHSVECKACTSMCVDTHQCHDSLQAFGINKPEVYLALQPPSGKSVIAQMALIRQHPQVARKEQLSSMVWRQVKYIQQGVGGKGCHMHEHAGETLTWYRHGVHEWENMPSITSSDSNEVQYQKRTQVMIHAGCSMHSVVLQCYHSKPPEPPIA